MTEFLKGTTLAVRFAFYRKRAGLTYDQLAKKTNSSKPYLWGIETGLHKKPSAGKLQAIAEAFDVDIEDLLS